MKIPSSAATLEFVTTDEVIDAFARCMTGDICMCSGCAYEQDTTEDCDALFQDACSLLSAQQAEIERLKKHNLKCAHLHYNDGKQDLSEKIVKRLEKAQGHDGLPSDVVWNNALKIAVDIVKEVADGIQK